MPRLSRQNGDPPLLPARMVNEYQYCPRLAYLEWVQGEWTESADTVEGRHAHRRVDKPSGDLPDPAGRPPKLDPVKPDKATREAAEDWRYWVAMGHAF